MLWCQTFVFKVLEVHQIPSAYYTTFRPKSENITVINLSIQIGTTNSISFRPKARQTKTRFDQLDGMKWNKTTVSGREKQNWAQSGSGLIYWVALIDTGRKGRAVGPLAWRVGQAKSLMKTIYNFHWKVPSQLAVAKYIVLIFHTTLNKILGCPQMVKPIRFDCLSQKD